MDIMQAILNIEEKARGISDSAKAMQDNFEQDLQAEIQRREECAKQDVAKQLDAIRQRLDAERQEEMEALESTYEKKLEELSKRCKAGESQWVSEITKAVLEA